MSLIQLNYAFLLFWSIFGEIYRELLFLVQNLTFSEKSPEILRKFVFLNKFEKVKIKRKIWICLNNFFLIKPEKGTNINKNSFSPQNEPHRAKQCFSVVLKHFWGNSQRTSLFSPSQKVTISEKSTETLRKLCFFFLTSLTKGKILRKIWICLNNFFDQTSKMGKHFRGNILF